MKSAGELPTPADAAPVETDTRCMVCDHDLPHHDPIGLRYCRATQAGVLTRGCICRAT